MEMTKWFECVSFEPPHPCTDECAARNDANEVSPAKSESYWRVIDGYQGSHAYNRNPTPECPMVRLYRDMNQTVFVRDDGTDNMEVIET